MINFTDNDGQQKEVNWFTLPRKFRRTIKTKNPTLYEKINNAAKEIEAELEKEQK